MKLLKKTLIRVSIFIVGIVGITVFLQFKKSHFDIATAKVNFQLSTSKLTMEFTNDYAKANAKYFSGNSGSKVLQITGKIQKVDKNMRDDITILLKANKNSPFGVHCTFSNKNLNLKKGQIITVKGLLNAGLHYDRDLELYENAIMDKSIVVQ